MLNEKHEDIMKVRCKQQLKGINYKRGGDSMFSNASRLFTSGYMNELQNDPSYAKIKNDSNCQEEVSSQFLNFNRRDLNKICKDQKFEESKSINEREFKDILQSVLMKESEMSISNTIHCSEAEELFKDESFNNENRNTYIDHHFKNEHIIKKNIPINRINTPSITEFTASRNMQVSVTSKINKEEKYKTVRNINESAGSTWRNSNDIKEHPSIDDSKCDKYQTKDRYQKYLGKRRSASRGVFNYAEADKSQTSRNVLQDIQNNGVSSKIYSSEKDKETEKQSYKEIYNSSNIKQKVRHLRTKTMGESNKIGETVKMLYEQLKLKESCDKEINDKTTNQLNKDLCFIENYEADRKMTMDCRKRSECLAKRSLYLTERGAQKDFSIWKTQDKEVLITKTPKIRDNCQTFREATKNKSEKCKILHIINK